MKARSYRLIAFLLCPLIVSACGTVLSAAQEDCLAVGLNKGTPDYESCVKARVREREMDYSNRLLPSRY
jgi:hypothetical protein